MTMKRLSTLLVHLSMLIVVPATAQQHYTRTHARMMDEATALMANGEYLNAARIFRKLIPVDTAFMDNYYNMGFCMARVPGQREKAYPYLA